MHSKLVETALMKSFLPSLLLGVILTSCHKESIDASSQNSLPLTYTSHSTAPGDIAKLSSISILINGTPLGVTSINYNRSNSTFNFTAQNNLQKVDAYCYRFYENSRWSFQHQDSINYSERKDTVSAWNTQTAANWGSVYFDCCYAPLADSLVAGEYSGIFSLEGEEDMNIAGNFHLIFR